MTFTFPPHPENKGELILYAPKELSTNNLVKRVKSKIKNSKLDNLTPIHYKDPIIQLIFGFFMIFVVCLIIDPSGPFDLFKNRDLKTACNKLPDCRHYGLVQEYIDYKSWCDPDLDFRVYVSNRFEIQDFCKREYDKIHNSRAVNELLKKRAEREEVWKRLLQ